jgi:Domain of unknown function (DUF4286)
MIIYNITINIDDSVHDEWLEWMKKDHIPDVMKTGMFKENKILRLLGDDESGGRTYSIQFFCESMEKYKQYENIYASGLREESNNRFKDKFVAFRSLLETIE